MDKETPLFAIVGTPIGNLQDMSERAKNAISQTDTVFAEDTRKATALLNFLGLKKKIVSCHKDNEKQAVQKILTGIGNGLRGVLVSEAGMPCISDPGSFVVRSLLENGSPFEVISGPTALIQALIASGFSGGPFYFHGFTPHKDTEKRKVFENLQKIASPIIFYESPKRVKETAALLLEYFPAPIALCREMTKIYEETIFISKLEDIDGITEKGEFAIVVNNERKIGEDTDENFLETGAFTEKLRKEGFTGQEILKILKCAGVKRNEAYKLANPKISTE